VAEPGSVLDPGDLLGPLDRAELRRLILAEPPLVDGYDDLDMQLQPHGLDVRLDALWRLEGVGRLGRESRELPGRTPIEFGPDEWVILPAGAYLFRLCESVHLPTDVMALGFARSSLLRCGASLGTAVWDAGYAGRSEVLLSVQNAAGLLLQRGTRVLQLVFFRLARATGAYDGRYQGEHLG
jgi:dUTP pyrophosphatase